MSWCKISRESCGRCNYFKTDKDKKWYYIETDFLYFGLWPVESFIGTENKEDKCTQMVSHGFEFEIVSRTKYVFFV